MVHTGKWVVFNQAGARVSSALHNQPKKSSPIKAHSIYTIFRSLHGGEDVGPQWCENEYASQSDERNGPSGLLLDV
jgi:hypothetical protein